MNHTKTIISIGQLLEITPYSRKQIMAALTNYDEKSKKPTQTYQVMTKAFNEKIPMISVIMKNK